jgi:large subunit ribosomal protein L13
MIRTEPAKEREIESKWYVVDATDQVLGRLATKVAAIIRGKHKPDFTPHLITGDFVVVLNADKVTISGNKALSKEYKRFSGYRDGLTLTTYEKMMEKKPEYAVQHAVKGMLPKNRLGRKMVKRLFVYTGDEHPHSAQKPEKIEL